MTDEEYPIVHRASAILTQQSIYAGISDKVEMLDSALQLARMCENHDIERKKAASSMDATNQDEVTE